MEKTWKLRAGENLFAWIMLVFSLFVLVQAYDISGFSSVSSPGMFPMMAAAVMVVSATALLVRNRRLEHPEAKSFGEEMRIAGRHVFSRIFLIYSGIIILYMVIFEPLGFVISSAVFLFISIFFLSGSGFLKSLLISGVSLGVIYLVFHTIFRVVLP